MVSISHVPSRLIVRSVLLLASVLALVSESLPLCAQTAINNINLPQAPQFPQGTDRIKGADGTECSRSTAPRKKYMDVGMYGGGVSGQGVENQYPIAYGGASPNGNNYGRTGGGVYARLVINLDAESENYQIDCGRLYNLEIERLQIELEQARLMGVGKPVSAK